MSAVTSCSWQPRIPPTMAAVVSVSPPRRRLASSRWLAHGLPQDIARLRPWSWRRTPSPLWMVPTVRWPLCAAGGLQDAVRTAAPGGQLPGSWGATTASIGYCSMAQAAISATTQALMIASGAPWVVREIRVVSSRRCIAAATGVAQPNGSAAWPRRCCCHRWRATRPSPESAAPLPGWSGRHPASLAVALAADQESPARRSARWPRRDTARPAAAARCHPTSRPGASPLALSASSASQRTSSGVRPPRERPAHRRPRRRRCPRECCGVNGNPIKGGSVRQCTTFDPERASARPRSA